MVSAFCGIPDPALQLNPISLLVPGELPDNLPGPAVLSEAEGADTFFQLLSTVLTTFAPESGEAAAAAVPEDEPEAKQPEAAPLPALLPAPLPVPVESRVAAVAGQGIDPGPTDFGSDHSADPLMPLPPAPKAAASFAPAPLPFIEPLPAIAAPSPAAPIPSAPEARASTLRFPLPSPSGAEWDAAAAAAPVPASERPELAGRHPALPVDVPRDPSPQFSSPLPAPEAEPAALPPSETLVPVQEKAPVPAPDAGVEVREPRETKEPAGARVRPAPVSPALRAVSPVVDLVAAVREPAPAAPASHSDAPRDIVPIRPPAAAPDAQPQAGEAIAAEPLPELPPAPTPDAPPAKASPSGSEAPSLPVANPAAAAPPVPVDRSAAPRRPAPEARPSAPNRPEKPIAPETPQGEVSFVARLLPDPADPPEQVRIAAPSPSRPVQPAPVAPARSESGTPALPQENGPKPSVPLPPQKSPSPEVPQPLRKSPGEAPDRAAPQVLVAKPDGSRPRIAAAPVTEPVFSLVRPQEPRPSAARTLPLAATQSVAELAPELSAATVHEIVLRLPAAEAAPEAGRPVDLVFRSHAGRLQLAVHSPDPQLAQSMRASLHELAVQLEQRGFEAAPWNAVHSPQASADQPDTGARREGAPNPDRDDGRSRGRDQQEPQDSPRRRAADAWREQWMRSLLGGVSTSV